MIIIAYIDPGSGLLVWQAVMATMLGLLFYMKKTRDFIVRLVRKPMKDMPEPQEEKNLEAKGGHGIAYQRRF